jgi:hypothetical protein
MQGEFLKTGAVFGFFSWLLSSDCWMVMPDYAILHVKIVM